MSSRADLRACIVLVCLALHALAVAQPAQDQAPAESGEAAAPATTAAPSEPPAAPLPPTAAPVDGAPSESQLLREELERLRAQSEALAARVQELEDARVLAELSAADDGAGAELAVPEPFRIYGFADFGFNRAWVGERSFLRGFAQERSTFVLGNLNLYFDFQPGPAWQVLTELRFSAYPHGVETDFATPLGGDYERIDTSVVDVASPATGSTFRWGSVLIERAYVQHMHSEKLSVRIGQFLTPYGIWNVDHGTPTQIALILPRFIAIQTLPARQIGIEVHGRFLVGGWQYGYDAYVSNGRTAAQLDVTDDKAVGLRLTASRLQPLPLTFGVSAYYGQIDDVTKTITSFDPFLIDTDIVVEGTEVAFGADVSLDIDALRIRSEGIARFTRFEPGKRPPLSFGIPGSQRPDSNEYHGYLIAAYQLPLWGLEPFGYGELAHYPSMWGDEQASVGGGLNIHFTPFAQLKTQLNRVLFFDLNESGSFSDNDMTLLYSRMVVAF